MEAAKPEEGVGELEQAQEVGAVFDVADEQRAAFGQPRQRPLDHPAFWQQNEALSGSLSLGQLDHLQLDPVFSCGLSWLRAGPQGWYG